MSQLDEDIAKLGNEVVTKGDLKAAFSIMSEITGAIALFGLAATALTVWIPGLGIPISAGIAQQMLRLMAREYCNLPTDQRRVIAKAAKYLHGIFD